MGAIFVPFSKLRMFLSNEASFFRILFFKLLETQMQRTTSENVQIENIYQGLRRSVKEHRAKN